MSKVNTIVFQSTDRQDIRGYQITTIPTKCIYKTYFPAKMFPELFYESTLYDEPKAYL